MSENYGCSECNKTFGRKDNAERHNVNIHDGLATIYDKRSKSSTSDAVSSFKPTIDSKNSPYQNKFKKMQLISDSKKKPKMEEYNKLFYGSMNFGVENDSFFKVMRLFGQLDNTFEELEMSLGDQKEDKVKTNIIYGIIHSVLKSSRPVKSMKDTAELYKSLKCLDKMTSYISRHDNISNEEAKAKLQQMVKESKHFKRIIN